MINRQFMSLFTDGSVVWQTFSDKAYKEDNLIVRNGKVIDKCAKKLTGTVEDVEARLVNYQSQGAGAFFQVNGKGRGGEGVESIRAVFLDLDGSPLEPVLRAVKEGDVATPNAIVQSSEGRYHVYWLVDDCEVGLFRRVQKALIHEWDGDPQIHNLDRVMRVPGTKNYKYNKEGFVVKCKVLHHNVCSVHEVVDLSTAAQQVGPIASSMVDDMIVYDEKAYQQPELRAGNRTEALISEAGRFIATISVPTPDGVLKHLKQWEKERLRPGDPLKTHESYLNEIMPGVHKFIEEKKQKEKEAETYVDRMAERFRAQSEESAQLFRESFEKGPASYNEFCARYMYVSTEQTIYDKWQQSNAAPWKIQAFKQYCAPFKVENSKGSMATKWLNDSKGRSTVHVSCYVPHPYIPQIDNSRITTCPITKAKAYNTYQQTLLEPATTYDATKAAPMLEHISYLCNDDKETYERMLNWIAFTIQKPDERIPCVPLIISKAGVGKGWLSECLTRLLGEGNVNNVQMSQLNQNNQFNGFLVGCKLVVVHETKGTRAAVESLKSLITEKALDINVKYGANKKMYVYANMLMFSNHDNAMPLDEGDRRYWVIRHMREAKSVDYYTSIFDWLESDGPAHAFNFFLNRDISSYDHAAPAPMTPAKLAMIKSARPEDEQTLVDAVEDREGIFALDVVPSGLVIKYVEQRRGEPMPIAERRGFLKRLGRDSFMRFVGQVSCNGQRQSMYAVRNYSEYENLTPEKARAFLNQAIQLDSQQHKLRQVNTGE